MKFPLRSTVQIGRYVAAQKRKGELYPLVLMLEPTLACNLACIGCGKCIEVCHDNQVDCIDWATGSTNLTRVAKVDDSECIGCDLCSIVCPVHECITMEPRDNGLAPISWSELTQQIGTPGVCVSTSDLQWSDFPAKIAGKVQRFAADPGARDMPMGTHALYNSREYSLRLDIKDRPASAKDGDLEGSVTLFDPQGRVVYEGTGLARCNA